MPTYGYECQACGTKFDLYQKFEDKPITKCPNCKKNKVRRVFAPAAIVFKGSGWYKTDSRSKSSSTAARNDKAAEKASEGAAPAAEKTEKADKPSSNGSGDGEASKPAKPKKEAAASKSDD
jgi:putative FmdB family regulatory protein